MELNCFQIGVSEYKVGQAVIAQPYLLIIVFRVTEDGDAYVRADDENYENDSVRQLENELKMEEYLKQKLQDEAYQVKIR